MKQRDAADTQRLLLLTKYSASGGSSRVRLLQFAEIFSHDSVLDVQMMLGDRYLNALQGSRRIQRVLLGVIGVLRRVFFAAALVSRSRRYDTVIMEQEFLPIVFRRLETWFLKRITRGSLIIDIDDANYLRTSVLRDRGPAMTPRKKSIELWHLATRVVCGSELILEDVKRSLGDGSKCVLIPSSSLAVTETVSAASGNARSLKIGWIGSPSTSADLAELVDPLEVLSKEFPFEFLVVGSTHSLGGSFPISLTDWTPEVEKETLDSIRIGVMPVADDVFRQRKCGYKIVQYFSAGVPAVVSDVGGNRSIVERDGLRGGFVASSHEDWIKALTVLLGDEETYHRFSRDAREIHRRYFSFDSAARSWKELLQDLRDAQIHS